MAFHSHSTPNTIKGNVHASCVHKINPISFELDTRNEIAFISISIVVPNFPENLWNKARRTMHTTVYLPPPPTHDIQWQWWNYFQESIRYKPLHVNINLFRDWGSGKVVLVVNLACPTTATSPKSWTVQACMLLCIFSSYFLFPLRGKKRLYRKVSPRFFFYRASCASAYQILLSPSLTDLIILLFLVSIVI